eukprot:1180745-Prorocentrum_minimum.AAC.3
MSGHKNWPHITHAVFTLEGACSTRGSSIGNCIFGISIPENRSFLESHLQKIDYFWRFPEFWNS